MDDGKIKLSQKRPHFKSAVFSFRVFNYAWFGLWNNVYAINTNPKKQERIKA